MDEHKRDHFWASKAPLLYASARTTAFIAGIFSAIVAAMLLIGFFQRIVLNPLSLPATESVISELKNNPANETIKSSVRELDLLARKAFFTSLSFTDRGALLLAAGIGTLLLMLHLMKELRPAVPSAGPGTAPDRSLVNWAIAGAGVVIVIAALAAPRIIVPSSKKTVLAEKPIPEAAVTPAQKNEPVKTAVDQNKPAEPVASAQTAASAALPPVDNREIMKQWPNLRGPYGLGIAYGQKPPTTWDVASGKNIKWKTAIPLAGFNSPVVWGSRVFLTAADEKSLDVFCIDADTGKIVWRKSVRNAKGISPKVSEDTGFAASSAATDGKHVFAVFATGDLACFDIDGKLRWTKAFGEPGNNYGYASSLIVYKYLFVQMDTDNGGTVYAINPETGAIVWQKPRKVEPSWASPVIVNPAVRPLVALAANPRVVAYDVTSGAAVFSAECLSGEVAPSPAFARGTIVVANEYASITAFSLTSGKEIWKGEDDLPNTASPLATETHVFTASPSGVVSCYDIVSGKRLWFHETDDTFYSSPVIAGGNIYLASTKGKMFVFTPANVFTPNAGIPMGEAVFATPAFVNNRIYIRTSAHLYCMEAQ
ncbi:MAG: PQQ-binding-like beta-propeller repeat protein [Spirochaetes bacterium]|nr:PQQ-binding-like beta-propeller repeat protein [Spirochaetota bacterium]